MRLLLCLYFSFVSAQLLWRVQVPNHNAPSYLFGTAHFSSKSIERLLSYVFPYVDSVEVVAVEINPQEQGLKALSLFQKMVVQDSTYDLSQWMSRRAYRRLIKILRSRGMEPQSFLHYQPMFIHLLLVQSFLRSIIATRQPVDLQLCHYAVEKGKTCKSLETIEEQFQAYTSLPLDLQAKLLAEDIKHLNEKRLKRDLERLHRHYLKGDLSVFLKEVKAWERYPGYREAMLTNRNQRMVERLWKFWQEKRTVFVAVGALHLAGEDGIVALLKQQGCLVEPIALPSLKPGRLTD